MLEADEAFHSPIRQFANSPDHQLKAVSSGLFAVNSVVELFVSVRAYLTYPTHLTYLTHLTHLTFPAPGKSASV